MKEYEILPKKQKYLLDITREKGILKLKDIFKVYSNKYYGLNIINRLVQLGYLKKCLFLNKWRIRE